MQEKISNGLRFKVLGSWLVFLKLFGSFVAICFGRSGAISSKRVNSSR